MVATVVSAVPADCVGAVKFPVNAPVPATVNAPPTDAVVPTVNAPVVATYTILAIPALASRCNVFVSTPPTLR